MVRAVNLFFLAAMIVGAVVTYNMKHDAEVAAAEVARLESEVAKERDRITLLRAEFSLLTQPARLQSVVDAHDGYFQLRPFAPDQLGTIDEIPFRSVEAAGARHNAPAGDAIAAAIRVTPP